MLTPAPTEGDGPLYQIHRYPADMIDVVRLRRPAPDLGTDRVVIRPVLPQDDASTRTFFGGLSQATRHLRFLSPVREVSERLLERLTHVDYANHLPLVAEVHADRDSRVVAEARYARTGETDSAEFAVTVAEAWQGRGLASLMLGKLACRARAAGISRLLGETLAGNAAMLHLARKAGFTIRGSADAPGVLVLERHLVPGEDGPCGAASALAL